MIKMQQNGSSNSSYNPIQETVQHINFEKTSYDSESQLRNEKANLEKSHPNFVNIFDNESRAQMAK